MKPGARIEDRVELDAVCQAVARSRSILQWNRLRAKTQLRVVRLELKP
jgi:hypothetical protein